MGFGAGRRGGSARGTEGSLSLAQGQARICNAYTPSLRMRGVDFQTASNEQEAAGLSFSKF